MFEHKHALYSFGLYVSFSKKHADGWYIKMPLQNSVKICHVWKKWQETNVNLVILVSVCKSYQFEKDVL